jgi:predicted PurR-regulated permease PerM
MEREKSSAISHPVKVLIGIALLAGVALFIYQIRGVLVPFVLAFVLAYVLAPIVDRMEGRGLGRTSSILLVFVLAFTGLGFGVIKAGDKLTGEVRELSDRMLRDELSERKFSVVNNGEAAVLIDEIVWQQQVGDIASFKLLKDKLRWPVEIKPGEEQQFQVSFTPESLDFSRAGLLLHLGGADIGKKISLFAIGNAKDLSGYGAELSSGISGGWQQRGIEVSLSYINFGEAGPNVLTDISKIAATLQPTLQSWLGDDFDLVSLVKEQGDTLIDTLLGSTTVFLGGVVSGLTFVVIVPFVAFFFLKEGRHITRGLIELVPNSYFELCLNVLHQINGQIGGYIRGQILATSVVATLAVSALYIIGLKYALPIGLLAGIANMIPFLGPLIGIIAASIVALATGGEFAMALVGKVIIIFLVIQLIDNIAIQPTVVAKSVEMHPLMILFVVMVGSQLMGIVGMLVAVPLTGIIKVSAQTIYAGIRGYKLQ